MARIHAAPELSMEHFSIRPLWELAWAHTRDSGAITLCGQAPEMQKRMASSGGMMVYADSLSDMTWPLIDFAAIATAECRP